MRDARLATLLCVIPLLGGCGGGGGTDPGPGPGPGPDPDELPDPNPLSLETTLDDARGVTVEIVATAGGELTATDASGNAFTLTIPANALPRDTDITLTPVASVAGIPGGGSLLAAVEVGPADLAVAEPLTIEVTLTTPQDPATFFPFQMGPSAPSAARAGMASGPQDFMPGLATWTCDASGLVERFEIRAQRGLILGMAIGGRAVLQAVLNRLPSNACDFLEANIFSVILSRGLPATCSDVEIIFDRVLSDEYVLVVKPALEAAATAPGVFRDALQKYLCWRGLSNMMPPPLPQQFQDDIAEARELLNAAAEAVVGAAQAECGAHRFVAARDLEDIHRLLGIGVIEEGSLLSDLNQSDIEDLYEDCMTFELEAGYQSTMSGTLGAETFNHSMRTTFDGATFFFPLGSRTATELSRGTMTVDSFTDIVDATDSGHKETAIVANTSCLEPLSGRRGLQLLRNNLSPTLLATPNAQLVVNVFPDVNMCYEEVTEFQIHNSFGGLDSPLFLSGLDLPEVLLLDSWGPTVQGPALTQTSQSFTSTREGLSATAQFDFVLKHAPR